MSKLILLTGAAGKTGRAVMKALRARRLPVRALVHRPEQQELLQSLGARETITADISSPSALPKALAGVDAVYHICPNLHPAETRIGCGLIEAARAAGVGKFVFHSVLHPQAEAMPHHWRKLRVEECLIESGLDYTVLQPAAYMQNLLVRWDEITAEGTYRIPYPAHARIAMVDLRDVAEVAATVLAEPAHAGAIYELCGPELLSQREVASVLSEELGRPVTVVEQTLDDWEASARNSGLGEVRVRPLRAMFEYYARCGLTGNPTVLGCLLGRPPSTLRQFIRRVIHGG